MKQHWVKVLDHLPRTSGGCGLKSNTATFVAEMYLRSPKRWGHRTTAKGFLQHALEKEPKNINCRRELAKYLILIEDDVDGGIAEYERALIDLLDNGPSAAKLIAAA